jgi:hypothetical protein
MENPGLQVAAQCAGAIEVARLALSAMCLAAALDEGVMRGRTGNGKGQSSLLHGGN